MRQTISILYKDGTSIFIEVPENYYFNRYGKKSEKRLHQIFMKDYRKFVNAFKNPSIILNVGDYLPFSNASICGKDVLSIDIKSTLKSSGDNSIPDTNKVFISGLVQEQTSFSLKDTSIEAVFEQLKSNDVVDKLNNTLTLLLSYFARSDVEFTIKSGKKSNAGRKKKVVESNDVTTTTLEVEAAAPKLLEETSK